MIWQAIGDLVPTAVGVALSPAQIIAVILMLGTPKARATGPSVHTRQAGLVVAPTIGSVRIPPSVGTGRGNQPHFRLPPNAGSVTFANVAGRTWSAQSHQSRCRQTGASNHPVEMSSIWLVTGAQASGKSTVADRLARRFERGVHVRGGQFYRWAVSGWVQVGDEDEREASRLLDLRYRLSAQVAAEYAAAGFTTVVQDNIYGADVEQWLDRVSGPKHLVVLRPRVDVVERRDAERQRTLGKVAYRGGFTPAINNQHLARTPSDLGLWLDTSEQTPDQTVDEIIERATESRVS